MIRVNADGTMTTSPSPAMTCHLSQKSRTKCGPHNSNVQLQTLDELDAASMRIPGKQMKKPISDIIPKIPQYLTKSNEVGISNQTYQMGVYRIISPQSTSQFWPVRKPNVEIIGIVWHYI